MGQCEVEEDSSELFGNKEGAEWTLGWGADGLRRNSCLPTVTGASSDFTSLNAPSPFRLPFPSPKLQLIAHEV